MRADEDVPLTDQHDDQASELADRLVPAIGGSALWGWLGPLLVTALGTFLRFNRLSDPRAVVFDETYYVGDAYGILRHGVEINHVKNANAMLASGRSTHILAPGGEFVVHPPLGKVLIAGGEWLFGLTPFGWRFAVAVVGSLAILMTARIARRMTRSTLLGCVAGLLLALDGLEFVMSRTALLDIFVMFWVLAAFGCLLIDRDRSRARIAAAVAAGMTDDRGPRLGIRWWRIAGRAVPRPCLRVEVERHLVHPGVRVPGLQLGPRRPAGRRIPRLRPRRAAPGRQLAAGLLRAGARRLPTWPPGAAGSPPARVTTGTGPRSTATTLRCCPRWTRCTSTTRPCGSSASP